MISLNSVLLLLLLVNFESGFRLEMMYVSLIIIARSSLTHLHGFHHFFRLYQQNKSSEFTVNFRQVSNHYKRVLEAAQLVYANKTKESITSQKFGSQDFWRVGNSVFNKGKSAITPLFNGPEVLSFASDKAKFLAENFSKNSNLDNSDNSLPVFHSRTDQYGFRSSWSIAKLLTVVSDRIARMFNKSWAIRAVALDISKTFERVWHAGLLHKLMLAFFTN